MDPACQASGCNCSTQASTKMSPYYMLYARYPVIPPAHVHRFLEDLDLQDVQNASRSVMARVQLAQKIGIMAGKNFKIAQHRDTLRYATIRSGGYLPPIRHFDVGDFAYLKNRVLDGMLQIPAKRGIYRVKKMNPNGAVLLQGKIGSTNYVCNLAPCHLPDIDPTLDPSFASFQSDAVLKLSALLVETRKHLLLQLSCPCRQVQLCNPILSYPHLPGLTKTYQVRSVPLWMRRRRCFSVMGVELDGTPCAYSHHLQQLPRLNGYAQDLCMMGPYNKREACVPVPRCCIPPGVPGVPVPVPGVPGVP
eukprot:1150090-Pelagomonas_calceolata.AAC.1